MATTPELDDTTKADLAEKAARLVSQGIDRRMARQIVWNDYQAELCAAAAPTTEPVAPEVPTEKPAPAPSVLDLPQYAARFFTPESLRKNRQELERVKRLVGLRSY